jgi:hypothetical protein
MTGIKWHGIRNNPPQEMIGLAQLRWFGHAVRMGEEKCHKMAWQARTQEKIPKGRPRETWEGGTQKNLKERGIEWNGERAIARNRERW